MKSMRRIASGLALTCVVSVGWSQSTESPSVVPVGQCWIEMDAAVWGHDRRTPARDETRHQQFELGAGLVTWGIRENWDVQIGWAGWTHAEEKTGPGGRQTQSGRGDSWLRAKWNFSGDEAEESAWALLPYLKMPTADDAIGNGHWEPGVALVYGAPQAEGKWIGAMVSVDSLRDEFGGHEPAWFASAVVGFESGWYGELAIAYEPESAGNEKPLHAGVGYAFALGERATLDFEVVVGLNRAATDFTGVLRFTRVFGELQ